MILISICSMLCSSNHGLKRHFKNHFTGQPEKCRYCDQVILGYKNLRMHVRSCSMKKSYTCIRCSKKFPRKIKLAKHMWRYRCKCCICKQVFSSEIDLTEHVQTHTSCCPVCQKYFSSSEEFSVHFQMHKMPCTLCGKIFINKVKFYRHISSHKCEDWPC